MDRLARKVKQYEMGYIPSPDVTMQEKQVLDAEKENVILESLFQEHDDLYATEEDADQLVNEIMSFNEEFNTECPNAARLISQGRSIEKNSNFKVSNSGSSNVLTLPSPQKRTAEEFSCKLRLDSPGKRQKLRHMIHQNQQRRKLPSLPNVSHDSSEI